jgi:hypothetical protein
MRVPDVAFETGDHDPDDWDFEFPAGQVDGDGSCDPCQA